MLIEIFVYIYICKFVYVMWIKKGGPRAWPTGVLDHVRFSGCCVLVLYFICRFFFHDSCFMILVSWFLLLASTFHFAREAAPGTHPAKSGTLAALLANRICWVGASRTLFGRIFLIFEPPESHLKPMANLYKSISINI